MWDSFNTYGGSYQNSFETLCNQLFERYLSREYPNSIDEFKVINGAGGDGGIEAYGKLSNGDFIAIQSKWFKQALDTNEIKQIRKSITGALVIRPNIKEYIICIPHNVSSIKIGRGKKPTKNSEDVRIKNFEKEIKESFLNVKITWWFEQTILNELQLPENEGVNKYWFEKEVIHSSFLKDKFDLQKTNYWLKERYVGDLHTKGDIQNLIDKQLNSLSFRKKIVAKILDLKNKINCTLRISTKFINVTLNSDEFKNKLKIINSFLEDLIKRSTELEKKLIDGVEINLNINDEEELTILNTIYDAVEMLEAIRPTNFQKPIYQNLKISLREFDSEIIHKYLEIENDLILISTSLILGKPGTGKTLGLAYAVEEFVKKSAPAILIQAKAANSKDWTQLLSKELELSNWNKNEIFNALEILAHRKDCQLASNKIITAENTKVLICIDGLDEDVFNEDNWFDRINEAIEISNKYKRIRFVFSAREYFYNNQKLPIYNKQFKELRLKREGDVKVEDVSKDYFRVYNINIKNHQLIKEIDSLFALKLFCDNYKNRTIKSNETVQTAIADLINLKVERINGEYLESLETKKSKSIKPVQEFLNIISDLFYFNSEVSHTQIYDLEIEKKLKYLNNNEIELLIEFISNNGILIKYEREKATNSILREKESFYNFSYQSILETIVSSKISYSLINQEIDSLPDIIFNKIPFSNELDDDNNPYIDFIPNRKIIENIITDVFVKSQKLIGIDNFLTSGLSENEIFELQLSALYLAPNDLSCLFKDWITKIFNEDYIKRFQILQNLIIPLSYDRESAFNAMFLHNILKNIPTVFERDKFWSGLDSTEKRLVSSKLNAREYELNEWSIASILDNIFDLDETDMFDGLPLVYAWGLTTVDQKLRENIRIKLTNWALLVPFQFKKLLELMILINDPQINEDLASITLGLATKCKDKKAIHEISLWCLNNIFNDTDKYRNIIVRYGFRSIIERAFQYSLLAEEEVKKARPYKKENIKILKVDKKYIANPKEEFYPIAHDLSWYVIKEAYDDFLSVATGFNSHSFEKDNTFINDFYNKYSKVLKGSTSSRTWGMSSAIAYIKSLGFDRVKGSSFTDATHGSKSKVFTYEEKYVWLAVHYLKGYLSDYLPYTYDEENKEFKWIDDYSRIVHINNPMEDFLAETERQIDEYFNPPAWIIKEELAPEINNLKNIQNEINEIVNQEPKINFSNWLSLSNSDFDLEDKNEYLCINQYTSLTNSSKTVNASIECIGYLILENDFKHFFNKIIKDPKSISISHFAHPSTDTYTNPSNLFWMNWIDETNNKFEFYENKLIYNCLARVMTNNVDGEKEIIIPSKKIRELLEISELDNKKYLNADNEIIGFNHEVNTKQFSYGDRQELVVLNKRKLFDTLKSNNLKLFWLTSYFIKKNPLNDEIKKVKHIQKFRRYIIWLDDNYELQSLKYFDNTFSNE